MTKIVLKHGTGVPSDTDLEVAEVAIDNVSGAMYTKLADDSVKHLNEGGASDWGSITGKPTEYPPEDHDHDGVYQPVGDYIEDADSDGKQYARQDGAWSEIVIPDGGSGSSVHIGDTPPANPSEGQQWMEVPASGDATMWIYDGGKWLQQPGGKDGAPGADGNIADATEQGVIATWDDTSGQWTPDGAVVVSGGHLKVSEGYIEASRGGKKLYLNPNYSLSGTHAAIEAESGMGLMLGNFDNAQALTIDSSGNVGIGGSPKYSLTVDDGVSLYGDATTGTVAAEGGKDLSLIARSGQGMTFKTGGGADSATRLTIDSSGDAKFSGSVRFNTVPRPVYWHTDNNFYTEIDAVEGTLDFYAFDGVRIYPTNASQTRPTLTVQGDATFSGTVTVNGNRPVISTRDLIETLHTLREATKDETTIKGLRDAIGNAVGGLIEKFEAMQSTATQEIDDE